MIALPAGALSAIAIAGALSTAASTALGVYGTIQQGNAAQTAANTNAAIAGEQAKVAANQRMMQEQAASNERTIIAQQSSAEAEAIRLASRRRLATAQNNLLASGVSTADNLDLLSNQAAQGELTAMQTEYKSGLRTYENLFDTSVKSYNSSVEETNYINRASQFKAEGANAKTSSLYSAVGQGLGGVAALSRMPSFG